ncbi:MAG: CAP domain-containing protein [Marinifilaceae bacterium]
MNKHIAMFWIFLFLLGMEACDGSEKEDFLPENMETIEEETGQESSEEESELVPLEGNQLDIQKMVQLVNDARTKGVSCDGIKYPPVAPLKWNSQLESAAFKHSRDMESLNYFSHTSKNGQSFGDRILKEGYTFKAAGENIAKGHPSEETVVKGWLASKGHCANIMSASFTEMGVARSGEYWTQDFGAPMQ